MAPKAQADTAATAAPAAPAFEFDTLPLPVSVRANRKSDIADKLKAMPMGASFLEPVEVPGNITDATERAKSFAEAALRVSNKLSGAIRRFKSTNTGYEFARRTVNDDTYGHGVRVFRVEVGTA